MVQVFLMNPGRNRMLELMLNRLAMGPARYLLNKRENNSGILLKNVPLRTSENFAIFPERKGLMFDTYPWALRFDVLRHCVGARFAEVLQMRALYGFLLNEPANKQMMAYNANALPNAEVWTHRVNWHFYRWNPCHWFMRQHTKVQRYFLGVHSWSGVDISKRLTPKF
jgi:hypothetical protein